MYQTQQKRYIKHGFTASVTSRTQVYDSRIVLLKKNSDKIKIDIILSL